MPLFTAPVQPLALYDGDPSDTSNFGVLTSTGVYLVGWTLQVPTVLSALRCRFNTNGTGHYDIGLYDGGYNGVSGTSNLLTHSGVLATAANVQTFTLGTAMNLSPGNYWLAFWIDNATDTVLRVTGSASMTVVQQGTIASGGLTATTAGMTGLVNTATRPILLGLRSGGWS